MKEKTTIVPKVRVIDEQRIYCITEPRVGHIVTIDPDDNEVMVDYKGNPFNKPLSAKIGRPFQLQDLEKARDHMQDIRLEFQDNDAEVPIIMDIYFSMFERKTEPMNVQVQDLHINARRIIIEGAEEVLVKNGLTGSRFSVKNDELEEQTDQVSSDGKVSNKVKGPRLFLN